MKTYSENEIKELAKPVFAANPKEEMLLATSDGQFFFEGKLNAAQLHARQKGGKKTPLKIYTVDKVVPASDDEPTEVGDMTIKEVTAYVAEMTDLDELKVVLEAVTSKGAEKAVLLRIQELTSED